jgi:hypothetical protein
VADDAVSTPSVTDSASEFGGTASAPQEAINSSVSMRSNQAPTAPSPQEFWAGSLDIVSAPDNSIPPSGQAHAVLDALLAQQESWTGVDA